MSSNETGIWNPRPKLLDFYMPGSATCLLCQIKRHGEVKRKEIYCNTSGGKRKGKHTTHLQPFSGYRHEL
jgi:hypothetical protein